MLNIADSHRLVDGVDVVGRYGERDHGDARPLDQGSVPVAVPYGLSDLDFVAIRSTLEPILLPDGTAVGPRLVLETKDEYDFDPTGRQFGQLLRTDAALLGESGWVPSGTPGSVKFSMLRQAHYDEASKIFGTREFDRIFVVHAVDPLSSVRI